MVREWKGEQETVANGYMLAQYLSRNPFCSRPVDPQLATLSGSREGICFLHPTSVTHEATSVSQPSSATHRHAVGSGPWQLLLYGMSSV